MSEAIDYGAGDPDVLQMTLRAQRSALLRQIPYFTTAPGVRAAVGAIRGLRLESIGVRSLQEIHKS